MKINNFVILLICSVLLVNCNNNTKNLEQELLKEIQTEINVSKIIIVSDKDCSTCLLQFSDFKSTSKKKIIGIYYAKYPKDFIVTLKKINSNISWIYSENKELLKLLRNNKTKSPYIFNITEDKIQID